MTVSSIDLTKEFRTLSAEVTSLKTGLDETRHSIAEMRQFLEGLASRVEQMAQPRLSALSIDSITPDDLKALLPSLDSSNYAEIQVLQDALSKYIGGENSAEIIMAAGDLLSSTSQDDASARRLPANLRDFRAWLQLVVAFIQYKEGNYSEALEAAEAGLQENPTNDKLDSLLKNCQTSSRLKEALPTKQKEISKETGQIEQTNDSDLEARIYLILAKEELEKNNIDKPSPYRLSETDRKAIRVNKSLKYAKQAFKNKPTQTNIIDELCIVIKKVWDFYFPYKSHDEDILRNIVYFVKEIRENVDKNPANVKIIDKLQEDIRTSLEKYMSNSDRAREVPRLKKILSIFDLPPGEKLKWWQ